MHVERLLYHFAGGGQGLGELNPICSKRFRNRIVRLDQSPPSASDILTIIFELKQYRKARMTPAMIAPFKLCPWQPCASENSPRMLKYARHFMELWLIRSGQHLDQEERCCAQVGVTGILIAWIMFGGNLGILALHFQGKRLDDGRSMNELRFQKKNEN